MDEGWFEQAACRGMGPKLFFPLEDEPRGRRSQEAQLAALQVCAGCEVRVECLDYVCHPRRSTPPWQTTAWASYGVWGGVSARGRERLLGKRLHT